MCQLLRLRGLLLVQLWRRAVQRTHAQARHVRQQRGVWRSELASHQDTHLLLLLCPSGVAACISWVDACVCRWRLLLGGWGARVLRLWVRPQLAASHHARTRLLPY
jgi:hypothetical protein